MYIYTERDGYNIYMNLLGFLDSIAMPNVDSLILLLWCTSSFTSESTSGMPQVDSFICLLWLSLASLSLKLHVICVASRFSHQFGSSFDSSNQPFCVRLEHTMARRSAPYAVAPQTKKHLQLWSGGAVQKPDFKVSPIADAHFFDERALGIVAGVNAVAEVGLNPHTMPVALCCQITKGMEERLKTNAQQYDQDAMDFR